MSVICTRYQVLIFIIIVVHSGMPMRILIEYFSRFPIASVNNGVLSQLIKSIFR